MNLPSDSILIEALRTIHDRSSFSCGKPPLDRYIRAQATQDIRRGVASVFVAVMAERHKRILGFFTLSAASIVPSDLPPDAARRLPRHPVPAALIGRLAVDQSVARRGLGSILLADAMHKAMTAADTVAMAAVVVGPLDDEARSFYAAFGFQSLHGPQQRMFLALSRRAR